MKRILDRTVNFMLVLIIVVVMVASVYAFTSKGRGFTAVFGYAALAIRSESMTGENPDSFAKGDLIFIKVLNNQEKKALSVGQVVTFYDRMDVDGDGIEETLLNTHRVTKVLAGGSYIVTKGDNAESEDGQRSTEYVVGAYVGKMPLFGHFVMFIQSRWGFLVSIVLPSFLILYYCLKEFLTSYKDYEREKRQKVKSDLKEIILTELKSLGR